MEPDKVDAAKPVDQPQATITAPVEAPKEDKTSASVGPQVKTEAKSAPAVPAPTTQASTSSKKKKKGSGSNCCVITWIKIENKEEFFFTCHLSLTCRDETRVF